MILRNEKGQFVKGTAAINPFLKGHVPWSKSQKGVTLNTGRTHFKKGEISDENHPNWKGDRVGYVAMHSWVRRKKGKPLICMNCGAGANLQWANRNGEYKRDLSDWISLCAKCHLQHDDWINKGWKTRRRNNN